MDCKDFSLSNSVNIEEGKTSRPYKVKGDTKEGDEEWHEMKDIGNFKKESRRADGSSKRI